MVASASRESSATSTGLLGVGASAVTFEVHRREPSAAFRDNNTAETSPGEPAQFARKLA
jgi:hypothetical protein